MQYINVQTNDHCAPLLAWQKSFNRNCKTPALKTLVTMVSGVHDRHDLRMNAPQRMAV